MIHNLDDKPFIDLGADTTTGYALLLSDARGRYIPRDFVELYADEFGVSAEDRAILADPEHEYYWDTWSTIEQTHTATDAHGNPSRLYHSGDLWAYTGDFPEALQDY